MKRLLLALALALVAALPAPAQTAAGSETTVAGRAHVVDGDTLDVAGQRVDLASIEAPNTGIHCHRPDGSSWPCGQNAAFALANIVARHWVHCRIERGEGAEPVPGYCTLAGPTGPDVNAAMLRQGWAHATTTAPDHYRALEADARKARIGIWGNGRDVAPR